MNVEIGTETPIFLFWEYLFRNFGILTLQCIMLHAQIYLITKILESFKFEIVPKNVFSGFCQKISQALDKVKSSNFGIFPRVSGMSRYAQKCKKTQYHTAPYCTRQVVLERARNYSSSMLQNFFQIMGGQVLHTFHLYNFRTILIS